VNKTGRSDVSRGSKRFYFDPATWVGLIKSTVERESVGLERDEFGVHVGSRVGGKLPQDRAISPQ
jgi:hypothetical protein